MNTKNSYTDKRGSIKMILESCSVGSISEIDTEPGQTRASHYHRDDGHWVYVTEGQIILYEQDIIDENAYDQTVKKIVLNKGDCYFTGPMIRHLMHFEVWTRFFCFSLKPRHQGNYENDTVRFSEDLKKIYENQQNAN